MTEKELKKLNRKELLEMLFFQTERVEELEAELQALKEQINKNEISINSAGSIAEASLKVSKIFDEADSAAKIYLDNVKKLNNDDEVKTFENECRQKALKLLADTERLCKERENKANEYCNKVYSELDTFLNSHKELKDFVKGLRDN